MLEVGIQNECSVEVTLQNTAKSVGSGSLSVFATPSMIALMEKAAAECVQPLLEGGQTSVGTLMNVSHLSATPVGMKVTAKCTLSEIDGRRLCFDVEASDERGLIGKGTHERFIVNAEKFQQKANNK